MRKRGIAALNPRLYKRAVVFGSNILSQFPTRQGKKGFKPVSGAPAMFLRGSVGDLTCWLIHFRVFFVKNPVCLCGISLFIGRRYNSSFF